MSLVLARPRGVRRVQTMITALIALFDGREGQAWSTEWNGRRWNASASEQAPADGPRPRCRPHCDDGEHCHDGQNHDGHAGPGPAHRTNEPRSFRKTQYLLSSRAREATDLPDPQVIYEK